MNPEIAVLKDKLLWLARLELLAVSQYEYYCSFAKNFNYFKLAERIKLEVSEERDHFHILMECASLIDKNIFTMSDKFSLEPSVLSPKNVRHMFEQQLETENYAIDEQRKTIILANDLKEYGIANTVTKIMRCEQEHVLFINRQLRLIEEIGLESYVSEHCVELF